MKLMRSLFQTVSLILISVVFFLPLRADTSKPTPAPSSATQSALTGKFKTAQHFFSTLLANAESGLLGGVVPVAAILLAARGLAVAMTPAPREEDMVEEQPPVEIPPLRPQPERVTSF